AGRLFLRRYCVEGLSGAAIGRKPIDQALYVTERTASTILRALGIIACSMLRAYGAGMSSLQTRMMWLSRSSMARSYTWAAISLATDVKGQLSSTTTQ